ncbi:hypothetical protein AB6A40_009860 [Gnathostoma spinigerum]|uniref:Importin N-terminal domain-containing protein n=1 Tax=Gnathostoma spinigerum TaxID=75299 RepID=A0ABD6ETH6_9BILA
MAEIGQVANILNMTLESDTAKRKKAEAELKQMESLPGISIVLMQLIASEQTLPATRLAAAVALKNFVKVNWNKEHCEVEIQDEERKQLRELTLQTMFGTTGMFVSFELVP